MGGGRLPGNYNSSDRVAFVSGHAGTGMLEISVVTLSGFLGLLLRNLAIPWLFPAKNFATGQLWEKWLKNLLDFCLIVVPTLLTFTIFSDRVLTVLVIESLFVLSLLIFCLCEYWYLYREKPSLNEVLNSYVVVEKPNFVTYARAYTLIATSIAILAVDFPVFPRRFTKTDTYGYSLMDVGVGSIVLANAIVGPEISRNKRTSRDILKCFPLFAMGLARLLLVKLSGYHEVVTEYGVHWNFFFTLAVVKILSSLAAAVFPIKRYAGLLSLSLIVGYQVLLTHFGLKHVILGEESDKLSQSREGIFDANREGLISVVGYLAIYFAGLHLGAFLRQRRGRLKEWFTLLGQCWLLMVLYGSLTLASELFVEGPSRRMANLTYMLWMIFITIQQLTCYLMVEVLQLFGSAMRWPLFSYSEKPFELLEPCLMQRVNRRALFHFVLANLMTGGINLMMETLHVDDISAMVVLLIYSYLLSVIVFIV